MATFKFKSSGNKASQPTTTTAVTPIPLGIKTPLQFSDNSIFAMHYDLADQVHDNLRNLLLTNWGERLGFYSFGANLRQLCSEISNIEQFDSTAIENIRDAVSKWMPFVSLVNFSSSVENSASADIGVVKITITYNVPQIGVENKSLQIVLHVI